MGQLLQALLGLCLMSSSLLSALLLATLIELEHLFGKVGEFFALLGLPGRIRLPFFDTTSIRTPTAIKTAAAAPTTTAGVGGRRSLGQDS